MYKVLAISKRDGYCFLQGHGSKISLIRESDISDGSLDFTSLNIGDSILNIDNFFISLDIDEFSTFVEKANGCLTGLKNENNFK